MRKLPVTGTLTQVTACADSLYNRRLYLASTHLPVPPGQSHPF
jgi:hypothetical protein